MKVFYKTSDKYTPNPEEWVNYTDLYDEKHFEIEVKRSSMVSVQPRKESIHNTSQGIPVIDQEGDNEEDEEDEEVVVEEKKPVIRSKDEY
jgi:hypothetical protein